MTKFCEDVRNLFFIGLVPQCLTTFLDQELDILQKMAYDMLRQDNMKPGSVTHETKTRWEPKKQRMVASSQRYANRIQNSQVSK